ICGINFQRYARAIKERLAAFRLYVFSLGSFIGALSRIVKLIYLFQLRYLTFLTPLNFPVVIRVLNLFLVLFFFGGFVMPAFLKRTVEFFDELLMLRRIHYNLVSLLALINDVCSLLPINKDMAYYVTRLCQKFSLSLVETEQTVESACIYAVLTNKTRLAKENPSGKDSYVSRTTVKQAAAAFAEEIKFYDGVYKQIQYAKERCDTQNLSSEISRDMIPIGARIIKVVGDFLNKSSSVKEGIMLLKEGAGNEFDPEVVEAFIEILQEEKVIVG
ncbi:MAG: hypothetical protein Q8M92_00605, partial [Candidatus Subteraquimicrobiales bacterium]|nr:hypothetical protein [Candidatus Subteraquimicrobiales bacterium]